MACSLSILTNDIMTNDSPPAPPKKFFEKNRPDIREPQRRCCTFAPLEIESGICAPTNKKLRAHRGGAATLETTDRERVSISKFNIKERENELLWH